MQRHDHPLEQEQDHFCRSAGRKKGRRTPSPRHVENSLKNEDTVRLWHYFSTLHDVSAKGFLHFRGGAVNLLQCASFISRKLNCFVHASELFLEARLSTQMYFLLSRRLIIHFSQFHSICTHRMETFKHIPKMTKSFLDIFFTSKTKMIFSDAMILLEKSL